MSPGIAKARALLKRLGHEEVVESPESHSSVSSRLDARRVDYFMKALGLRRLFDFRAVHEPALRRALASLEAENGAAAAAWRGRILRLLGEKASARAQLLKSLASEPSAEAEAWLGELSIYDAPKQAGPLLASAARRAPRWHLPRLWLGLALLKNASPRKALAELDAALRLVPKGEGHLLQLARAEALLRTKDRKKAFVAAMAAVKLDPASPAGWHLAGGIKFADGDLAAATEYSNQARNRDVNLEGPFFAAIGVISDWERPAVYLKSLDRAIKKNPAMAVLYAARAELKRHPKLCQYEEALADYAKAVELDPGCSWTRSVLARAEDYAAGGRSGLKNFNLALKLCPSSGWAYSWRGAVKARLGESGPALADFAKSLALMPWYSFAYAWRGALLNRLGRFQEALEDLDTAIRLDPYYIFSYNERFSAKRGLKDDAGAVADLNFSFSHDPKYTWLGSRAAETDAGKRAELLRGLDEAVARAPKEPWLLAWRGYSRLQWGMPEAIADLDAASAMGLSSAELEGWRGLALLQAGSLGPAAAGLERSIKLNPKGWFAHKVLSEVRAAQSRKQEALAAISRAAELAPTTVSVLVSQAKLEHELGQDERALAVLAKAAGLDPRYAEIYILMAEIRLGREELPLAAGAVEKALSLPHPSGRAFLVRGLIRQKLGHFKGQIDDFAAALAADPGLFQEKERRVIEDQIARINDI